MDLELATRKRKWCIVLGAFGFTCYSAYNLPSLVKKRHRIFKLFSALFSLAELVSAIGNLSKDLNQFLRSDSDQIPQSLKQLSKIAKSNELSSSGSLTRISQALAVGIMRGYGNGNSNSNGFSDRALDKLFSDAGSGFASAVVGSFAKNLVMTLLYSEWGGDNEDSSVGRCRVVGIVCEDDKWREVIGDVVQQFVSTAVTVYLDKTMYINTYDEFFHGLTNPKHEGRVRDMLVSICNGAVETGVQSVWAANKTKNGFKVREKKKKKKKNQESGRRMGRRNRKFVLDMTFESVRSLLQFLLEKMLECIKRGISVVHHQVVDKGVDTMRYYASGSKSCDLTSMCLTLCLNILNSPWILAPY